MRAPANAGHEAARSVNTLAYLKLVHDDLAADDLDALVGMPCDRSLRFGDPIGSRNRATALRRENVWIIESGESPHASPVAHLQALRARLAKRAARVGELVDRYNLEVQVVLYLHDRRTDGELSARLDRHLMLFSQDMGVTFGGLESRTSGSARLLVWRARPRDPKLDRLLATES